MSLVSKSFKPIDEEVAVFNKFQRLGIQWGEFQWWYRFPILKTMFPELSGYNESRAMLDKGLDIIRKMIKDRDRDQNEEDFITTCMKQIQEKEDSSADLWIERLPHLITDLFIGNLMTVICIPSNAQFCRK